MKNILTQEEAKQLESYYKFYNEDWRYRDEYCYYHLFRGEKELTEGIKTKFVWSYNNWDWKYEDENWYSHLMRWEKELTKGIKAKFVYSFDNWDWEYKDKDWYYHLIRGEKELKNNHTHYWDTLLECAEIAKQRGESYGDIHTNWERILDILKSNFDIEMDKETLTKVFIATKIARNKEKKNKDNIIDQINYLAILNNFTDYDK